MTSVDKPLNIIFPAVEGTIINPQFSLDLMRLLFHLLHQMPCIQSRMLLSPRIHNTSTLFEMSHGKEVKTKQEQWMSAMHDSYLLSLKRYVS